MVVNNKIDVSFSDEFEDASNLNSKIQSSHRTQLYFLVRNGNILNRAEYDHQFFCQSSR